MPTKLTAKRLEALYALLSEPMLAFDCGSVCAPANAGVPCCCDPAWSVPLLFRAELTMPRHRDAYWRPMPILTEEEARLTEASNDEANILCLCPGHDACERNRRALVCRTFPFEPHCHPNGTILGLTYIAPCTIPCPLLGQADLAVNPAYVRNSIRYWQTVFEIYPDERDLYIRQSRNTRRRHRRHGRRVPLFSHADNDTPDVVQARARLARHFHGIPSRG